MKKIIVCIFSSLILLAGCGLRVKAQTRGGAVVSVQLIDASNDEPVGFATVSLTPKGAAKPSKYGLTDDQGKGKLEGVRPGNYTFKAEIMGYKSFEKVLDVKENVDLGKVKLSLDQKVLDAASVSAVGNPIVVKKDTIEYNASSFKTTENDVLEDLLKKLPGVEINEDGSITANGKTISKITIDGKTFFLNDPQLASKNLPAKMIEKVKVIEKKSDQAEFTGIDDGEEEQIIDLSVKKGMMNGLIGNMSLGGGHDVPSTDVQGDYRFQGAGFMGKFTEKSNLSLIVNANNTNNRGFNDLSGGMMGAMRGGGMGRGSGGFGGGNGITTSYMGGLNGSWNLFDDKMELGSN
ncbi:MAG: carboxypeptidase-like regulatory domain-containing protein, partial [Bacteroidales bacterium]|nr:carboxypeptidase-like regulatory domain-containing protein [Bacteroidales bacterium]